MASIRTGRLLRDQNPGIHMDGKANFTGQRKKVGAGGRKPLGDLSNSVKPSMINQAGGGKKALDHGLQLKPKKKLAIMKEEATVNGKNKNLDSKRKVNAIAEEQFLHNHQECIKSLSNPMDLHHFLKIVELEDDSDNRSTVLSETQEFNKLKPESDPEHLDLEEVPEKLPEVDSSSWKEIGSPAHFLKTPKISGCHKMLEDFDVIFKLIETPQVSKF